MNTFSPTEAIKFGWKSFTSNPGFMLGMTVLLVAPGIIFSLLFPTPKIDQSNLSNLGPMLSASLTKNLIQSIASLVISLGVIKALLMFIDSGKGDLANVLVPFKQTKILINYVLAMILIYGLTFFGMIVFVIIGLFTLGLGFIILFPVTFYLFVRISLYIYYIIDKAVGPVDALKLSWNATKGNFWNMIVFYILSIGVLLAGLIALIVGLLVSFPVVMAASIYVYKMLSQQKVAATAPTQAEQPASVTPAT